MSKEPKCLNVKKLQGLNGLLCNLLDHIFCFLFPIGDTKSFLSDLHYMSDTQFPNLKEPLQIKALLWVQAAGLNLSSECICQIDDWKSTQDAKRQWLPDNSFFQLDISYVPIQIHWKESLTPSGSLQQAWLKK